MANVTPVFLIQRAVLVPRDDSRGFVSLDIPESASAVAAAVALTRWYDAKRRAPLLLIADPEGMEHLPIDNVAPVGVRGLRAHVLELAGESTPVASSEMLGWATSQPWPNGALHRAFFHYESQPYLRIIIERLATEKIHVKGAISWWDLACRMAGEDQAPGGKKRAKKATQQPTAVLLVANRGVLSAVTQPVARRFVGWLPPQGADAGVAAMLDELSGSSGGMWSGSDGVSAQPKVHVLALTDGDETVVTGDGGRASIQTWDTNSIAPLLNRPFPVFSNLIENFPKTYRLDTALMAVAGVGLVMTLFFGFQGWMASRSSQATVATLRSQIEGIQSQAREAEERKTKIENIEGQFSVETFTVPRGKPEAVQALGRALPSAFTVSFFELTAENRWRMEGFILSRSTEQAMKQAADQVRDALNANGFPPTENTGFNLDAREARVVAEGEWRPGGPTKIALIELVEPNRAPATP
jgi:hypothetical protein